jgi:hypothetical protein
MQALANAIALIEHNQAQAIQEAEDCHTQHPIFHGFHLMFSSDPHADRYDDMCVICFAKFD